MFVCWASVVGVGLLAMSGPSSVPSLIPSRQKDGVITDFVVDLPGDYLALGLRLDAIGRDCRVYCLLCDGRWLFCAELGGG